MTTQKQVSTDEARCVMESCKRPYKAKGYCNVHYRQWRQGKLKKTRYKTCSQEECLKKVHLHSLCEEHYKTLWGAKPAKVPAQQEAKAAEEASAPEGSQATAPEPPPSRRYATLPSKGLSSSL